MIEEREPDPPWRGPSIDAPDEIHSINRSFYRQRPHAYLLRRLYSVGIMGGRPDLVGQALADGVTIGIAGLTHSDWPVGTEDHLDYVALESEVLLFQTAEGLLRLVLAHARRDLNSPALNLAGLKSHQEFYRLIRESIRDVADEGLKAIVATTIHGTDSLEPLNLVASPSNALPAPTEEGLQQGRSNLCELLRFVADYVLDDNHRDVYNSAKHGLATRTGEYLLRIGGDEHSSPPLADQSGHALQCIAIGKRDGDGLAPVEDVIVWSNPSFNVALTSLCLEVMEAVWQLGRLRYVGQEPDEPFVFRTFEETSIDQLRRLTYNSGPSRGDGPSFITVPSLRWPTGIVVGAPE